MGFDGFALKNKEEEVPPIHHCLAIIYDEFDSYDETFVTYVRLHNNSNNLIFPLNA